MKIKYFGHSCFYIEDGVKILIDPFIPESQKMVCPIDVVPDLILVSHDHQDHIGESIDIAKTNGSKVVAIAELALEISKYKISVISGNIGGTVEYPGVKITFVKADHSCNLGVAVGFIININEKIIYFAGDTGVFLDMKIIRELYHPEIVILPIGGVYTMDPIQAIYALKLLEPKIVIPMHYSTFENLTGKPEDLERLINKEDLKTRQITLNLGQVIEF
jgi:L-ascorbate metabolism protein UlaG (beta-lactamase superfamily)